MGKARYRLYYMHTLCTREAAPYHVVLKSPLRFAVLFPPCKIFCIAQARNEPSPLASYHTAFRFVCTPQTSQGISLPFPQMKKTVCIQFFSMKLNGILSPGSTWFTLNDLVRMCIITFSVAHTSSEFSWSRDLFAEVSIVSKPCIDRLMMNV